MPFWIPLAAAGAAIAAFRALLHAPAAPRAAALALLGPAVLALPPFVDAPPLTRLYVAMACATVCIKMFDLHLGAKRGRIPGAGAFLVFLASPFSMVERRSASEPRPSPRGIALLGVEGVALLAAAAGAWLVFLRVRPQPFAVEHVLLSAASLAFASGATDVMFAGWLAAGGRGRRTMERVYLARTPAEFWRRWNRPINLFLFEDVARPLVARGHRAAGVLLAFAVSAGLHEYAASVAAARVQGYQAAFFMFHGVAMLATARLAPSGAWAAVGVALTLLFNLATSVAFYASLEEIMPWYSGPGLFAR
jgi:hypothetical protein